MNYLRESLALGLGGLLTGCAANPPRTVANVDFVRYQGLWYDIAHYPISFQRGCEDTTARYTLRPDGRITVVNTCRKVDKGGDREEVRGVARVPRTDEPAKLKVQFFWPFEGDYWIVDLDPHYQWAVVSEPRRQRLWILARQPALPDDVYQGILERLRASGFEPERLERTRHSVQAGRRT